jgi:hypothetical protein
MKKIINSLMLVSLLCGLTAGSKAPYQVYLAADFQRDYYSGKPFPNKYELIESINTEPVSYQQQMEQERENQTKPYHIEITKRYNLELRDSTNHVLWRKDNVRSDSTYNKENEEYSSFLCNPDGPLVDGVYLEKDGTVLLADSVGSRLYLQYIDGKKAYLPYGTIGLTSHGWVNDKYWLLSRNVRMHDEYNYNDWEEYYWTPTQTYLPYTTYLALMDKDGTLYKAVDLSQWGAVNGLQFDKDLGYLWFSWEKYVDDPVNGGRNIQGMAMQSVAGKVIISQETVDDDQDGYTNESGWSSDKELFFLNGSKSIRLFDMETGSLYARLQTANWGQQENNCSVKALSSKKSGLAFISNNGNLIVDDYVNGQIIAIIPNNDGYYDKRIELLKPDGSKFSIIGNGFRAVYSLK